MKNFMNLDKKRQQSSILSTEISRLEDCLKQTNNIKDTIECELRSKRKQFRKLQEILKIYLT